MIPLVLFDASLILERGRYVVSPMAAIAGGGWLVVTLQAVAWACGMMERGLIMRGLLGLSSATFRLLMKPLRGWGQEHRGLRIGLCPVGSVKEGARRVLPAGLHD